MSQSIERSEAIAFLDALRRRMSTLAFWSYDWSNGQELLTEGYVNDVNGVFLEIEPRNGDAILLTIVFAKFVRLDRDEAPYQIMDIARDEYDFVLGFPTEAYGCCIMAKDPRDATAPTPPTPPSTPGDSTPP